MCPAVDSGTAGSHLVSRTFVITGVEIEMSDLAPTATNLGEINCRAWSMHAFSFFLLMKLELDVAPASGPSSLKLANASDASFAHPIMGASINPTT